jgi:hypothetical protein
MLLLLCKRTIVPHAQPLSYLKSQRRAGLDAAIQRCNKESDLEAGASCQESLAISSAK